MPQLHKHFSVVGYFGKTTRIELMTINLKLALIIILILVVTYFGFGFINSYFGWYSHEHYKFRKGSTDIAEAKQRGVFVRQLKYKVEGYSGDLYGFTPFIEKGYTWGYHTSAETKPWRNTDFPYQVSFSYVRSPNFGVLVTDQGGAKFDSGMSYLKAPKFEDTLILEIGGEKIPKRARIKIFD